MFDNINCAGPADVQNRSIMPELKTRTVIAIGIRSIVIRIQVTDTRFTAIIPVAAREQKHQDSQRHSSGPINMVYENV